MPAAAPKTLYERLRACASLNTQLARNTLCKYPLNPAGADILAGGDAHVTLVSEPQIHQLFTTTSIQVSDGTIHT